MDPQEKARSERIEARPGLAAPGILLGLGFGGFVDGIVFHQLLQWHHLLSATVDHPPTTLEGLESNTLADGLFHAAMWMLAVAGLLLLWRAVRRHDVREQGRCVFGWTLAGWGIFNLVEGVMNHHLLQIHHVRDDVVNPAPWDLGFLASGLVLLSIGLTLARAGRHRSSGPQAPRAPEHVTGPAGSRSV